jgi:hypothetical protein
MRRTRGWAGVNVLWPWIGLATRYAEMAAASAEVIARRTQRIAMAGSSPSERDRREFVRMGQEKIDASTESARAAGAELLRLNHRFAMQAWLAMLSTSTDMLGLAGSRTPSQLLARQRKLASTLRRAAPTGARLSAAAASLVGAAMKPVHSRARRNAARLRRT